MTNLTHPDILKMERDGYLDREPEPIGKCYICGCEILPNYSHYNFYGCTVCDDYSCIMKYLERYMR